MAAVVYVSSNLLADAPRVSVRFEESAGRNLSDIRRKYGQYEAELRELNCERRQANRTNPDYRVESGKEYELVIPGKKKGWSKGTYCVVLGHCTSRSCSPPPPPGLYHTSLPL